MSVKNTIGWQNKMDKAYLEKLILEESKSLPAEILSEILEFIKFKKLKAFEMGKLKKDDLDKELLELNQTSLMHLEDEFADYKTRYPREK